MLREAAPRRSLIPEKGTVNPKVDHFVVLHPDSSTLDCDALQELLTTLDTSVECDRCQSDHLAVRDDLHKQ